MVSIKSHPWRSGGIWAQKGFNAFKDNPGPWLIFAVCNFFAIIAVSFIPFVGSIASSILPSIVNGLAMRLIEDHQKSNTAMSFDVLSPELSRKGTDLLGLGAINWGLNILAAMPMVVIIFIAVMATGLLGPLMSEISGGRGLSYLDETALVVVLLVGFVGFVISLVLLVLVFMATVFAPYLIVLKNLKMVDSLKLSFKAVQKNPWSITAISLWWLLFLICGFLLCGVGIIFTGPIIQLSIYFMAEDIFETSPEKPKLSLDK